MKKPNQNLKESDLKWWDLEFANPTDKNGKADDCECRIEISDGKGQYSDVYRIKLCSLHKNKNIDLLLDIKEYLKELVNKEIQTVYQN